jgi:integrase
MAGSIRSVGKDTWELRVYLGRDFEGRIRNRYVRFRGSKKQAEHELARMIVKRDAAPMSTSASSTLWGPNTTINDAIAAWRANGWEDLSPNTARRYEGIHRVHIERGIGRHKISTLNPYDIERFFRDMKNSGLSKSSVRQIRALMARACRLARRWSGNTLPNSILDTELPTWELSSETSVRAPNIFEVRALLQGAQKEGLHLHVFLRVIVATGMRRGEACALRWSDVDWNLCSLLVDESVIASERHAQVKSPKTRASIRCLAIDETTLKLVFELQRAQLALANFAEVPLDPDGFIFSYTPGGMLPPHPDTMTRNFTQLRKKFDIARDIHLHSLRHFQATALDPIISERQKQARLGWSTVHMARHYTDVISDEDRRAALHIGYLIDAKPIEGPTPRNRTVLEISALPE